MAIDPVLSADAVRRRVLLVLLAYGMPLMLAGGAVLMSTAPFRDAAPLLLFATYMVLGILGPMARYGRNRRRERARSRRPVAPATQAAILAELPELSDVVMLTRGAKDQLTVDGKRMYLGATWSGVIRPGAPLPDRVLFGLAHELRHKLVGTDRLLRLFRTIRLAYLGAAVAVYTSLLLNVVAILDDPDRTALTIAVFLLPYVAAVLAVVLDYASIALIWWLELDADAAALSRCRERWNSAEVSDLVFSETVDNNDPQIPQRLRHRALQDGSVKRTVTLAFMIGWIAAVMPLGMSAVFASTETDASDLLNASLATLYFATLLTAAATVLVAVRPGQGHFSRSVNQAVATIYARIYRTTMRWTGWGVALATAVIFWRMALDGWQGTHQFLWNLAGLSVLVGAFVAYLRAAGKTLQIHWVLLAAAVDALRLWSMAWLLRASSVLPFFDDLQALGQNMREHGDFVAVEVVRIWMEEPGWLVGVALLCGLGAGGVAILALRSETILKAPRTVRAINYASR
jgi:hypothetical protein